MGPNYVRLLSLQEGLCSLIAVYDQARFGIRPEDRITSIPSRNWFPHGYHLSPLNTPHALPRFPLHGLEYNIRSTPLRQGLIGPLMVRVLGSLDLSVALGP